MAWYDPEWGHRKLITIDSDEVAGNLTDFPVLISVTDADLTSALANGFDLLFTESDGETKLDHEIEHFDNTTGELRAWVKTDLSGSSETVIYLYYGNSEATDQQNVAGVWGNGFVGVYHLDENPSGAGSVLDSARGHHGNPNLLNGSLTEGVIGDGVELTATANQRIQLPNHSDFTTTGAMTVSLWYQPTNFGAANHEIYSKDVNASNRGDRMILESADNRLYWNISPSGGSSLYGTSFPPTLNTWHLIHGIFVPSVGIFIYVNGELEASNTSSPPASKALPNTNPMIAGRNNASTGRGIYDEVRVATVARSAEWVETEYNNQSDPGSFISVGAEQGQGVEPVVHFADAYLYLGPGFSAGFSDGFDSAGMSVVEKSHDTDVVVRATNHAQHGSDALVYAEHAASHSIDASLIASHQASHSTDALLDKDPPARITRVATEILLGPPRESRATRIAVEALLLEAEQSVRGHTVDALLSVHSELRSSRLALESLFRAAEEIEATHTVDALLVILPADFRATRVATEALLAQIVEQPVLSHGLGAALSVSPLLAHDTDIVLSVEQRADHSADAMLYFGPGFSAGFSAGFDSLKAGELSHSVDALLIASLGDAHTTDAVVLDLFGHDHSTDALVRTTEDHSQSVDAVLRANISVVHGADALVLDLIGRQHNTDVVVVAEFGAASHVGALILASLDREHSTGALLVERHEAVHQADSLIQEQASRLHGANAFLVRGSAVTHEIDALLEGAVDREHTADALVTARGNAESGLDSLLEASFNSSHSVDALVTSEGVLLHVIDAVLLDQFALDHSSDAELVISAGLAHQVDASVQAEESRAHSTGSLLLAPGEAEQSVDVLILDHSQLLHSSDALLVQERTQTHTADAVLSANLGLRVTRVGVESLLLAPDNRVEHGADALIIMGRGVAHSADALIVAGPQYVILVESSEFGETLESQEHAMVIGSEEHPMMIGSQELGQSWEGNVDENGEPVELP